MLTRTQYKRGVFQCELPRMMTSVSGRRKPYADILIVFRANGMR
jgi:hypothetical protein